MSKMTSALMATGLSAAMALTAFTPSMAAPVFVPKAPEANSDVINVQDYIIRKGVRGNFHRDGWRRGGWRDDGWRHNGWRHGRYHRDRNLGGALVGGLITGAIVGGVLSNNNRVYRGGDAHVQWCYDHYRTYRAWDNTYVPRRGIRAQCYSPYD